MHATNKRVMNHPFSPKNPQTPSKPQEVPGKENTPKQPGVYPPGDKPLSPTDPGTQPIDINS